MNPIGMTIRPNMRGVELHATTGDTWTWAHRGGRSWPCSALAGNDLEIVLASNGDLVDFHPKLDDLTSDELTAFTDDMLELAATYFLSLRKGNELAVCSIVAVA